MVMDDAITRVRESIAFAFSYVVSNLLWYFLVPLIAESIRWVANQFYRIMWGTPGVIAQWTGHASYMGEWTEWGYQLGLRYVNAMTAFTAYCITQMVDGVFSWIGSTFRGMLNELIEQNHPEERIGQNEPEEVSSASSTASLTLPNPTALVFSVPVSSQPSTSSGTTSTTPISQNGSLRRNKSAVF